MNYLLPTISSIIILIYVIFTFIKYGKTDCFSRTYYNIKHPWVFSVTLFTTSLLLLPSILEHTNEGIQFLPFLSLSGFMFVALAPHFLEEFEGIIHKTGALIGFITSQIWIGIQYPLTLIIWVLCFLVCFYDKKYWLYYMEITTWLSIVITTFYLI